jgi:hypothetical protein
MRRSLPRKEEAGKQERKLAEEHAGLLLQICGRSKLVVA